MSDKRPLPGAKKDDTDMADKPECILHCVSTLFQSHVQWKDGGPTTWEPKYAIQENAEDTVFAYWDNVNDGRLDAMDLATITVLAKEKPRGGNQKEICKRSKKAISTIKT
ncbi:putative chromo domain-containing protein [Colletotrichum sublineola]|uniref:Putative chromo domain-containing protein n=1 Tax=Colletotrichum sublineola TaxID=1173701 RepID=A0A066XUX9_COLSU|nr:putative chromo domain-containing protein [Colletotrichum sublineola]